MADWNDNQTRAGFGTSPGQTGEVGARTTFDAGLRKHMLSIYNYMASGVLLTGIVALMAARTGLAQTLNQGILGIVIMLSPLAIVFAMSFGRDRFSTTTLQAMFWGFAVLMGLSLSYIFLIYTGASIATTFFATSAAFAGLSLFGYTTQKDLSGWGSFLIMGVIGLIVASVINLFLQSSAFMYAISFIGVLIFAGLTAYDTQRLKQEYLAIQQIKMTNPAAAAAFPLGKMVVMGALSLYLDFINMFLFLLRFMGAARE
ncbi:Bax inhibitor-1/YccA family protein [Aurantiacibacter gangjinensis]|uniref:Membrane protein n=1 Tax=Aurantiacibacter gangjinensis TaxID=502682 RepID=A0A0G9MVY7_9SPHN|nr:Bax inhibitor-1/YccA family protein [Aurantiacibacter gangjinensis]APE26997.1 membrane protein [Aurantiacibacter gangjinensis]KLE33443.1 membrane protein [Aurantiacibacter gangjinensis]